MPSLSASVCTISAVVTQRLQPGPRTLTSFMELLLRSLEHGVEKEPDREDAGAYDTNEHRNQADGEDLAQDDHLGERQRYHRHHEGQHGTERGAFGDERGD